MSSNTLPTNTALYIRDACQLSTQPDPAAPPPLGGLNRHFTALVDDVRKLAGHQWLEWWREVLDYEAANLRGLPGPSWRSLWDWPELTALERWPELRRAALEVGEEARGFRGAGEGTATGGSQPQILAVEPGSIAAEVVAEMRTGPERLNAGVLVLPVVGEWSHTPRPGFLVCSRETAQDAEQIRLLLRLILRSCLGG